MADHELALAANYDSIIVQCNRMGCIWEESIGINVPLEELFDIADTYKAKHDKYCEENPRYVFEYKEPKSKVWYQYAVFSEEKNMDKVLKSEIKRAKAYLSGVNEIKKYSLRVTKRTLVDEFVHAENVVSNG